MTLTNKEEEGEEEREREDYKSKSLPAPLLPKDLPFLPVGHPDSMMSVESVRRAVEEFRVQPSDVIVATFPKTGTTVVTWMCHLLRTAAAAGDEDDGDLLNFDHLCEVVPWPLLSWDLGYDPNAQQRQQQSNRLLFPRVFKSHLRMASIYRGCRYIVAIRDPVQTAVSFYNFLLAKRVPAVAEMDLSTFTRETAFVRGKPDGSRGSLWEYYREYHILRDCPSVLVVIYEDIAKDVKASIRMIAKFMDIDFGNNNNNREELIEKVASMSTKEFMAQHMSKFEEPYERAKRLGRAADLSQLAPGAKVVVKPHQQVMDAAGIEFLDQQWRQTMAPLGYDSYESFASMFRTRNEKRFGSSARELA